MIFKNVLGGDLLAYLARKRIDLNVFELSIKYLTKQELDGQNQAILRYHNNKGEKNKLLIFCRQHRSTQSSAVAYHSDRKLRSNIFFYLYFYLILSTKFSVVNVGSYRPVQSRPVQSVYLRVWWLKRIKPSTLKSIPLLFYQFFFSFERFAYIYSITDFQFNSIVLFYYFHFINVHFLCLLCTLCLYHCDWVYLSVCHDDIECKKKSLFIFFF